MKKNAFVLAGLLGSLALVGCDGTGGNNLADPVAPTAPVQSSCASDQQCVKGRLEDGQVAGLNYTCSTITSTTTAFGEFSCPVGSTVQFSIRHIDSPHVVTLGRAVVPSPLKDERLLPVDGNGNPVARVYLTPLHLVGASSLAAPAAGGARNITRLLHALNYTTNNVGLGDNPARDIILSSSVKKDFLDAFGMSADLSVMPESTFEADIGDALSRMSSPRVLMAAADASRVLEKASYSILAGVYTDSAFMVSSITGVIINHFYGVSLTDEFFGELSLGIDRKGRYFGAGSSSLGPRNTEVALVRYDPVRLYTRQGQKIGLDGSLTGLGFDLDNSQTLEITAGMIDRNFLAKDTATYKVAYGDVLPADVEQRLGRFTNPTVNYTTTGLNLQRPLSLAANIDPAVWGAVAFPLHVTVTLRSVTNSVTSDLGVARFSVLADGNIVSDLDGDCAPVNLDTLKEDGSGDQELVVGVVSRAFAIGAKTYLEPLVILPKLYGSAVANAMIGVLPANLAQVYDYTVRLRVDSADPLGYLRMYRNPVGVPDDTVAGVAQWGSNYLHYRSFFQTENGGAEITFSGDAISEPTTCPGP